MNATSNWLKKIDGKQVDIKLDADRKEWFCGKDVCEISGYENYHDALAKDVRKGYKNKLKVLCEMHHTPLDYNAEKAVYISETGLYQLIFTSKLEAAERFGSWVFEEVLTSICKTGGYELQAFKNEIILKDKAHQKEINNAMKQLTFKDRQLTLKEEQHAEEITKGDKELNDMKLRCLKLSDQKLSTKP